MRTTRHVLAGVCLAITGALASPAEASTVETPGFEGVFREDLELDPNARRPLYPVYREYVACRAQVIDYWWQGELVEARNRELRSYRGSPEGRAALGREYREALFEHNAMLERIGDCVESEKYRQATSGNEGYRPGNDTGAPDGGSAEGLTDPAPEVRADPLPPDPPPIPPSAEVRPDAPMVKETPATQRDVDPARAREARAQARARARAAARTTEQARRRMQLWGGLGHVLMNGPGGALELIQGGP